MNLTNQFTKAQVFDVLDTLLIKHTQRPNKDGWVYVDCPYHNASKIESAVINVNHGGFTCFSCGKNSHIIQITMKVRGCDYKEALAFLNLEGYDYYKELRKPEKEIEESKEDKISYEFKLGKLVDFDPSIWKYTRDRGIDFEWLNFSGAKLNEGGRFNDYLIIPITDKELGINTFEARKVKEYEYLVAYYGPGEEKDLKDKWKEEFSIKGYEVTWSNEKGYHCISKRTGEFLTDDFRVVYLSRPKTLYKNDEHNKTLYNRNKLDLNKRLVVEEGLGADAKNRSVFNNLTCTFGSNLSDDQLKFLMDFPEILVIPDNDKASIKMIELLVELGLNVKVLNKTLDDKQGGYIRDIKQAKEMDALEWLYYQEPIEIA
jgi:DNA primase